MQPLSLSFEGRRKGSSCTYRVEIKARADEAALGLRRGDALEHGTLHGGGAQALVHQALGDELEDAASGLADGVGQCLDLADGREGAGDGVAGEVRVAADAVGAHSQGTRLDGLLDDHLHRLDVVVRRAREVVGAARAHHVRAERAVRDVGRHVEGERAALDHVHELGHGLPGPLHAAVGDRGVRAVQGFLRDLLDALHDLGEEGAVLLEARGEAAAFVNRAHIRPPRRGEGQKSQAFSYQPQLPKTRVPMPLVPAGSAYGSYVICASMCAWMST